MTTVYQYRVYCTNENAYRTVWGTAEPTACPHDASHAINPSFTTVVDRVSSTAVQIDSKSFAGTQGFYLMQGGHIDVPAGSSNIVTHGVTFDLPVRIYGIQIFSRSENAEDRIDMSINPNTVVGVITEAAGAGATTFSVSPTVTQFLAPGFHVTLADAGGAQNVGKARIVDAAASTITCTAPLGRAVDPMTTTVALTVYTALSVPLTQGTLPVGYGTMGSKPLPAGTTCVLTYHNDTGSAKRLGYALEYTY